MQAYTIGLSINKDLKLEKGKEKRSSAGSFIRSSSHVTAKFCQVLLYLRCGGAAERGPEKVERGRRWGSVTSASSDHRIN